MATENNIGDVLFVSAALPATNDPAGFEALAWTRVQGVQEGPQFGIEHADIDVPDIGTGFDVGLKGAAKGVATSVMCRDLGASDPGQAILKTQAEDPQGEISMKWAKPTTANAAPVSGDPVQYAQGFVKDYQENKPTTTSYRGFSVAFRQNGLTVYATEPV